MNGARQMMLTARLLAIATAIAVTLAGLAGCSSDSDSPADIGVTPDGPTPDRGASDTSKPPDGPAPDGAVDTVAADTGPVVPCTYSQAIEYVDEAVDTTEPCGAGDGTCVSGRMLIDTTLIQIQTGDIGEVYLFANPGGAPVMIYRVTTPPTTMPFKIPNIAEKITTACAGLGMLVLLDQPATLMGRVSCGRCAAGGARFEITFPA